MDAARVVAANILAQSGLRATAFTIDRLSLFGLHVHDIILNDGAIRISELTLTYSPRSLAMGLIDSAIILRPHVSIVSPGGQVMIGGVAIPAQTTSTASFAAPARWRIASIKLIDADISITTSSGQTHVVFSTDLTLAGRDIKHAALDLDISEPIDGSIHLLHVASPNLALMSRNGGMKLSFTQAIIAPKDLPWTVDDLSGEIVWLPDSLTVKISSSRVSNTKIPARVLPISVAGNVDMHGPNIVFNVHAAMSTASHPTMLRVDGTGTYDRESGHGTLRITSTPVTFQANGLQPRDFLPGLDATLPKIGGTASLEGGISWQDRAISTALTLHVSDGGAESKGVLLSNFHGNILITSLVPLVTAARQSLQGTIEAGGMPPSKMSLIFQLLAKPALRVDALNMDFVGGKIFASTFDIDPAHPDLNTTIGFEQVDLAEFFKLVSINGVGGDGKLDGQIPIQFTHGKIIVHDGTLSATGPGVLHLRTDVLPKQISEAGESVTLVLKELDDFHYNKLVISLADNVLKEGTIMLKIQGNNPAVLEGRPVNLNIKLETSFDRVIDLAFRSMQAGQELLRQTITRTQ